MLSYVLLNEMHLFMLFTLVPKDSHLWVAWAILGPGLALLAHTGGRQKRQTVQWFSMRGHFIPRRRLAISGDIFDFHLVVKHLVVGNIWYVEIGDAAEHFTVQSITMENYLALTLSSAVKL